MLSQALLLTIPLFLILPATPTVADNSTTYTAVDFILLNCGESSNLKDLSNRPWDADVGSRYAPPTSASEDGKAVSPPSEDFDPVPYGTARVFRSSFTYSFPVSTGHKFIRLHFNPSTYAGQNTSLSFFSVTANNFTLLSNFSAFLAYLSREPSSNEVSVRKEFIINVQGNQKIELTFTPSPGSSAFVNGIEIVSLPDDLYFRQRPIRLVAINNQPYELSNDTALETLYRLNVGGQDVPIGDDSGPVKGMFRRWVPDNDYLYGGNFGYWPADESHAINYSDQTPPYTAPKIVYRTSRVMANHTKNLMWTFPVDSGFYYLLRLHFCEIQLEVTNQNQRVFTVQINNLTAEYEADIIFWTGGVGNPIYKDYVTWVADNGRRGKIDLPLNLFPNNQGSPVYSSVLLNGLEIFKLSNDNRSLAAPNPDPPPPPPMTTDFPTGKKGKDKSSVIYAVLGSGIGVLVVVAAVSFLIFRRRKKVKVAGSDKSSWMPLGTASRTTTRTSGSGVSLPSDLCRHFTLNEIIAATDNFDDSLMIGKGGFGNVYKGFINDGGAPTVAVKRLNVSSNQGAREFFTEIEMLSKLRHLHLVSLIGYCYDGGEMILVYDYMAHGTLRDHLCNPQNPPLKWSDRLQICLGAAKGLHYLHTGVKHAIIHRDVKTTNILLDEKWVAKMSDFGLSKVGPTDAANTHVSTAVKGSIGYVDPEYYKTQQLTDKSDVYSFGVVLFEVLCGRPALLQNMPRDKMNLAEWAKSNHRRGTVDQIVDPNLEGQIAPECLNNFVETAIACLKDRGFERPTMSDVVWSLEFTLQLQEEAEDGAGGGHGFVSPSSDCPLIRQQKQKDPNNTTDDEELFSGTSSSAMTWSKSSGLPSGDSSEKMNSNDVFSEIKNPTSR
ncbi:receptor-like protein kinase FERONIA [Andrographis paniculata]|uniref:receptor-like protein kinase FERONIA n=1 Tax=Andrographis paniculata TaxID=175694 RepID=UPI0021E781C8|nr:receptor-like protein kinase FERONIA [Andrographis paniculata]